MTRAIILSVLFSILAAFPLRAADNASADTASPKETQLKEKRRAIELEMHKLRLELIKTDPEITRLHERIMAMHKELQIKIDSNPMMQLLLRKAEQLDREIKRVAAEKK